MGYSKRSSTTVSVLLILPSEEIDGFDGFWILSKEKADFQQALIRHKFATQEEITWRMDISLVPMVYHNEKFYPRFGFA